MKIRIGLTVGIALAVLSACGGRSPAVPATAATAATGESPPPADGLFMGRMWISTTAGAPRGSFMIFLPDHTMLMGSCVETYRLSEWGVAGDKIRWREDTIPIEAEVTVPRRNQMELQIAGQDHRQSFVLASAPYVCPDMPK